MNHRKPKLTVGATYYLDYAPKGSGFRRGEAVVVEESVAGNKHKRHSYKGRCYVSTIDAPPRSGWFDEDVLLTRSEAQEEGLIS